MESEKSDAASVESQAFDLLSAGNVPGAVSVITSMRDAQAALDGLARLVKRAYGDLKNIPAMIAIAWDAVEFARMCADGAPDAESARRYKARARGITYNAGANCWPGWGDPVDIDSADIAEGLKLAEHSYQLVEELGLGDKEIGSAHWLIGALQMAAGRSSEAIAQFRRAEEAFHAAQLPACVAMAQGYAALTNKTLPESHVRGTESLAEVLLCLRAMDSREAQFFADQLVTADGILAPW